LEATDRRRATLAHAAAFVLPVVTPAWIRWHAEDPWVRAHAGAALLVQVPALVVATLALGAIPSGDLEPWLVTFGVPVLVGLAELPAALGAARGEPPRYASLEESP
jgi:hypothetical protein